MMAEHWIYPHTGNRVSDGDSLLIRFRLFSDPYANGWGWAIDDLKINPLVDKIDEIPDSDFSIYPNPGNGIATVRINCTAGTFPATISIFNTIGQPVMRNLPLTDRQMTIDISHLAGGLYFIVIDCGNRIRTLKYNLIK
jgi:hypothetical protein